MGHNISWSILDFKMMNFTVNTGGDFYSLEILVRKGRTKGFVSQYTVSFEAFVNNDCSLS